MAKDGSFSADWASSNSAQITHGSGCLCGMTRRHFLAGTLAAAAAAASHRKVYAQAKPQRVDVHHHMLPPDYIAKRLAVGVGDGNSDIAQWTPARTLEQMDKNGIASAMLSLSQ